MSQLWKHSAPPTAYAGLCLQPCQDAMVAVRLCSNNIGYNITGSSHDNMPEGSLV